MQQGRGALALLASPVIGGAVFVYSPSAALLFDAATSVVGALACMAIRTPLTATPGEPTDRTKISDGVRFVLGHPVLRYASISGGVLNLVFNGLFLLVVALMVQSGRSALSTGVAIAVIGIEAVGSRSVLTIAAVMVTGVALAGLVVTFPASEESPSDDASDHPIGGADDATRIG